MFTQNDSNRALGRMGVHESTREEIESANVAVPHMPVSVAHLPGGSSDGNTGVSVIENTGRRTDVTKINKGELVCRDKKTTEYWRAQALVS